MENQKTRLNLQLRKFVLESRRAWSNSEILKKRKRHNRLAVMLVLWTGKVPLVVLSLVLPVLIVPLISVLLFPEVPLTISIVVGVVFSLFVAIGLRLIQGAKAAGTRFIIAAIVIAVLIGLLAAILTKFLS
jgi:lipopolysaccharide export LptBFGC system permease protein LptF